MVSYQRARRATKRRAEEIALETLIEGAREFSVKLTFDGTNSTICRVSKPIIDFLGDPESLKFIIRGKGIIVTSD